MDAADLRARACTPQRAALPDAHLPLYLPAVPDWQIENGRLTRTFRFDDYYTTLAFVNAVAGIAHVEDHHPELIVRHGSCTVRYDTHSVHGLSQNDFICAAKIDALNAVGHPRA